MRPIDADALICSFCNAEGTAPILGLSRIIEVSDVIRIIEDAPTVDAVPVRQGRWIGIEYDGYADGSPVYDVWACSECGEEREGDETTLTNFCPNCGTDMRKEN